MKTNTKLIFLFIVFVILDQLAKALLPVFYCNPNIAWSISIAPGIFYFGWMITISVIIFVFLKTKNYYQRIALTLILSGAISNFIDRVRQGCVIDFIDIKIWPVFNLADIYITIGVIMLFLNIIKSKCREAKP